MPTLTFDGVQYTVDHAVKGTNYIHGYDALGKLIVAFENVKNFNAFVYTGSYMQPTACVEETCNTVKCVGGKLVRQDGTVVVLSTPTATGTLKVAPINLLVNSDFRDPVNRNGATEYTGSKPAIDRWVQHTSGSNLTINDGFITAKGNVRQDLDVNKIKPAGKDFTIAYEDSDGNVYCASGTAPTATPTSATSICSITLVNPNGSNGYIRARWNEDNEFFVQVYTPAELSVTLKWIALYDGKYTLDDLPTYRPRGYEAELAACCQYDLQTGDFRGVGGMDLLWSNAKPSDTFGAQDIPLNLSGYSAIYIRFAAKTGSATYSGFYIPVGQSSSCLMCYYPSDGFTAIFRTAFANQKDKVVFGKDMGRVIKSTESQTLINGSAEYMIPLDIYGIV